MINIALFGPPGAGKGTQSESLIRRYNLFYISTGEILRKELAAGTSLGRQAQAIIASGGLVPDEIIVQIIERTITEHPEARGFLFDGFPRTAVQAYILEGLMLKLNTSLTCLINLAVPEHVSVDRLLKRGATSGRSDDNEQVIRNRLKEYAEKTLPVLDFFRERGTCHDVDGTMGVEAVSDEVARLIAQELRKKLLNIVIFGYPGSGRGSQGKALASHFGLEYIATGELLAKEITVGSPIGRRMQEMYDNGILVPDEIVVQLLERRLEASRQSKGYIFKGYPRTLVQSYILDGLLRKHGTAISRIIELEVPPLELINRLDQRSRTDRCMPYDTSTARIVQRLKEHEEKTVPVIAKYDQFHGVTKIDGRGTFDEVFHRLTAEIENHFSVR